MWGTNCSKCGSPNDAGATVCRECGAPLQSALRTSSTAVASLVCGILGWTLLPVLGTVLAIILGHTAKREIQSSRGTLGGDGLATAGLVLGYVTVSLALLTTLAGIVITVTGAALALPLGLLGCGLCGG